MSELRVLSLSPFVPSGKHYEGSRRLFRELGFEEIWESGGYAGLLVRVIPTRSAAGTCVIEAEPAPVAAHRSSSTG
jgi:hypothetical protein